MNLLPTYPLLETSKVLAFGAQKYDAHNWREGMEWSRLLGAGMRHLTAFNEGIDLDEETGLSHLAHATCCLLFLLQYTQDHPQLDDRYKPQGVVSDK
jgi:dATP/dGTP diphosphohydrolase, N-terminal